MARRHIWALEPFFDSGKESLVVWNILAMNTAGALPIDRVVVYNEEFHGTPEAKKTKNTFSSGTRRKTMNNKC